MWVASILVEEEGTVTFMSSIGVNFLCRAVSTLRSTIEYTIYKDSHTFLSNSL